MAAFSQLGYDLHTGRRSIDFIGRWRIWYALAGVVMLLAIVLPILRGGFNLGIEFTGGSEFRVTQVSGPDEQTGRDAVESVLQDPESEPRVAIIGGDTVRVQTYQVSEDESKQISAQLADAYGVTADHVSASYIDPSWGSDVSAQAVRGLVIFLLLAGVLMAIYFRTWKMSLAAILSLVHDLIVTAGVYGATGLEVTPAAMIGFLTILGYSLYDTVVVFDKIRENTAGYTEQRRRTFGELVNLAVNQTLIRSINTTVVALLPVGSILFIGAYLLGAGTLRDISLALFIGILVGAYSTIFIAAPTYALLRRGESHIRAHDGEVLAARPVADEAGAADSDGAVAGSVSEAAETARADAGVGGNVQTDAGDADAGAGAQGSAADGGNGPEAGEIARGR